jgi:hypothetical protein
MKKNGSFQPQKRLLFMVCSGLEITIKEVKIVGLIPAPGSFLLFI